MHKGSDEVHGGSIGVHSGSDGEVFNILICICTLVFEYAPYEGA